MVTYVESTIISLPIAKEAKSWQQICDTFMLFYRYCVYGVCCGIVIKSQLDRRIYSISYPYFSYTRNEDYLLLASGGIVGAHETLGVEYKDGCLVAECHIVIGHRHQPRETRPRYFYVHYWERHVTLNLERWY